MPVEDSSADALRRSKRDPSAFGAFYREHLDSVVVFMVRHVYDVDTGVELAAETLAQAFLGRRGFRGSSDLDARGWLFGIARRQLAMYFRRSAVERRGMRRLGLEPPRLTGEEEHARVVELAGLDRLRSGVRNELRRLSAEQREALQLRVVEELPYPEVADRLGITQQAARARVARGLKALAEALDEYGPLEETT
jgi:RNA polymerase sigma factor (sigma-70 family)